MFFKLKFSILKAWLTSLTVTFKNIIFYTICNFSILIIGLFLYVLLGVAIGIFDFQALTQDYSWVKELFLNLFRTISLERFQSIKDISGHEPYDILKIFFPKNILNHVLENKSWSEYVNVILLPKKVIISLVCMLISVFSMTTTIGYIKTALKLQDGQKASFRDMYQYFYLVPQYFGVKLVMSVLLLLWLTPCWLFLFSKLVYSSQNSFFFLTVSSFLILILMSVIYQRLKFMQYFVIDKNMSILDAIKASWSITKGSVIHLFLYSFLSIFLQGTFFRTLGSFFRLFYNNIDKQTEINIYKQLSQ